MSVLPDLGTVVMMFVRGGAECSFYSPSKCKLKKQVGARP